MRPGHLNDIAFFFLLLLVKDVHVALWFTMAAGCHVQIGYNQDFIALWSKRYFFFQDGNIFKC